MATTTRTPMSPTRKLALAGGLFYLATFVFSIPALGFYDGVLNNPDFVHGAGGGGVLWGAMFEMLTALTCIGTAVVLYPVIRRHGQVGAIGFVASRTLEADAIFVGVISLLSVFTLRQDLAESDAAGLATVLYRSRLVPRFIPAVGLIGAPLLLASSTGSLFGAWGQLSGPAMVLVLPSQRGSSPSASG